jgi:hypothetical protein
MEATPYAVEMSANSDRLAYATDRVPEFDNLLRQKSATPIQVVYRLQRVR